MAATSEQVRIRTGSPKGVAKRCQAEARALFLHYYRNVGY